VGECGLSASGRFYQTDSTRPLLFLSEEALPRHAQQLNPRGSQWGMMNETGSYPGQAWLWLDTFWYYLPFPPCNGPTADSVVWTVMAVLTLALILLLPLAPASTSCRAIWGCIA
jgi:hypothetical protein